MSTLILLTLSGLGLAALYFLVASGLTLVFGLADVLNFAHGLFVSVGAYAAWWAVGHLPAARGLAGLPLAAAIGSATGAVVGIAVERLVIRPLYGHPTQQILATVGLSLAGVAALQAGFGSDARQFPRPGFTGRVVRVAGAGVPGDRLLLIGVAAVVLLGVGALLRRSRFGLVVRAGSQDREMVTALGIDVRRAFTTMFALGGALAALAGALAGLYFGAVAPEQGGALLISAIVIVVIGGAGSLTGTALAAGLVALVQTYANYYGPLGTGDVAVVAVLALILVVRPQGLAGKVAS